MYDYPPMDRRDVQRPVEHFLFLAIQPDAPAADRATAVGQDIQGRYRIGGKLQSRERQHITLFGLCRDYSVPLKTVDAVERMAASLELPAFDVTLDRVLSFRRDAKRPLVLCGSDGGVAELRRFRQKLGLALIGAGFRQCGKESFNPHMTLLYDRQDIGEHRIDPIRWRAREFVLIDSLYGQTRHIPLGRWPLHGEPNG